MTSPIVVPAGFGIVRLPTLVKPSLSIEGDVDERVAAAEVRVDDRVAVVEVDVGVEERVGSTVRESA